MARRQNGPKRHAIYLRCSSDDQAQGDFTTIDVQRTYNTERILQQGGVLHQEYVDEGKTGTNIKRPGFEALIRDARAGLFDMVIVTYMSRLARGEAYHVAEFLLKQEGVGIELVREKFSPDLAGHIGKQMTILMDGMYPKMVSQWIRAKQEQMVKAGYFCGGRVPFGYTKVLVEDAGSLARKDKEPPKRLAPDAVTGPLVARAFAIYAETHQYNRSLDYLRSVTDRNWDLQTVIHMLKNDVYRGVIRYGENVNETAHEAIISLELWEQCRSADTDRRRSQKQNPVDNSSYYLRGLVYCVHCGSRTTPASHHGQNAKIHYYECLSALKKRTVDCPSRRVNAKALHLAVLAEVTRCAKHPTRIAACLREAVKQLPDVSQNRQQRDSLTRRLREVDQRIGKLNTAIEEGGPMRSLLQRLKELEADRLNVEAERNRVLTQIAENTKQRPDVEAIHGYWKNFAELWEFLTESEREQAMQALIEQVDIHSNEKGTCKIRVSGQVPISNVGLTSTYRAGVRLELTTFGL